MKSLVKTIKTKLIFCSLVATLVAFNVNANTKNESRYIVSDYKEYGLDRLSDLTSDFVSDITSIPSTLGCVALDIVITTPMMILCGGAVRIPTFSEENERKRDAIYRYRNQRDEYKRMDYQYQDNYPSQHETQEVDDFEVINECDTILCSKISCDRFLGKHKEGSAHNWDKMIQSQILDMLADNEPLPKIKRRECYNDKKDNHLIYTIWNKDKFKSKFETGGFDIIVDKRIDKDKSGQLFLTSFMWFANNIDAIDSEKNEKTTRKIKDFLINGAKTNYKLFKFPAIATKTDYNELQDKYLNKLRAVYLSQIEGISDSKFNEVIQLQVGFAKIMAQCIKDNPNNKGKCQETAKQISDWVLYSKTGFFSSKSTNDGIELNIPALKEMRALRDKIQEQHRYISSTNTTTATNLSKWVNRELYKTVSLYEFAPQDDYGSDKYCTSYSPQDLKCPIPAGIKQLETNSKDILYNVSLSLGDSSYNLFSYVPDDGYKIVFTGASNEGLSNEYKEEVKELILKANDSIEIAMLTLPEKNTPTYKELVETFAELGKRLIKENKEVKVHLIYGSDGGNVFEQYEDLNGSEFDDLPKQNLTQYLLDDCMESLKKASDSSINKTWKLPLKLQLTKVDFSEYTQNPLLWNHAKLIIVDRKYTNIGSTNLYENYEIRNNLIKNVSVTFNENPQLTSLVHKFMHNLVTRYNYDPNITAFYKVSRGKKQEKDAYENEPDNEIRSFINYSITYMDPAKAPVNMMVIPQYGHAAIKGNREVRNISEIAQVALLKAAKESIFISQSGIFPKHSEPMIEKTLNNSIFNDQMLEAIREKVKSGIKVTIVKSSNRSGTADDGTYDALSADAIKRILLLDDIEHPNHNLLEVVEAKNSNGEHVPNHATMIIVDNKAAYVGSHSIYSASHAEYGFIIQDEKFTRKLYDGYMKTLEKS